MVEVEEYLERVADVHVGGDVALGEEDFIVGGSGSAAAQRTFSEGGEVEAEIYALDDAEGVVGAEL